jgi:DNA-binding protein YbaB
MFKKFSDLKKAKAFQDALASEEISLEREGIKVIINGQMKIKDIQLNNNLPNEETEKLLVQLINEAFLELQKRITSKIFQEKDF